MNIGRYKCIKQPSLNNTVFTVGKEYSIMQEYSLKYFHTYDDYGSRCTFYYEVFNRCFKKVEQETMTTERYKFLGPNEKNVPFTIGKEYELHIIPTSTYPYRVIGDSGATHLFQKEEFNRFFQKVEPTNNNKEMKYKVTITNVDATGQEDVIVHENVSMDTIKYWLEDAQMPYKSILTEPMPEKKKVTVWFYLWKWENIHVVSNVNYELVKKQYDISTHKVSEIFSKEVEI